MKKKHYVTQRYESKYQKKKKRLKMLPVIAPGELGWPGHGEDLWL